MFSIFKNKPILSDLIPDNFLDIHSHVLPGLDDGAENIDQTKSLLNGMKAIGVSKCIVTPHTLPEIWENTFDGITTNFEDTKHKLEESTSNMLYRAASEYMINESFLNQLESEPLLTLKDNFVLIEMSYLSPPLALKEILFEIQLKGYQIVLAHPERYLFYHKNTKMYETLKGLGVQFQLNLLSSVGYYGASVANTADFLLKENFIDFVGSDVHHQRHVSAFGNKIMIKNERQLNDAIEKNTFLL